MERVHQLSIHLTEAKGERLSPEPSFSLQQGTFLVDLFYFAKKK